MHVPTRVASIFNYLWLAWDIVGDDDAREVGRLSASSWVVVWSGGLYGVELSCATVLISYSNRLLFELSLRGVVRLFWPVVASLCLLWCLVSLFNIIGSPPTWFVLKIYIILNGGVIVSARWRCSYDYRI